MLRLAINPLPWTFGPTGPTLSESSLRVALAELAPTGFRALHTSVPEGIELASYTALLDEYGFRAAPGYVSGPFDQEELHDELVETVRAHARLIRELGLDVTFVAGGLDAERMMRPAIGEGSDPGRTRRIADGLARAAEAAAGEGVRLALHPHVSSIIETEEEIRAILDATTGSALGFGPDTGHLAWAGMVPAQIISDYRDRVIAMHVKDVSLSGMQQAIRYSDDYMTAAFVRGIWTEPGRGVVDFDAVFDALPEGFDGWCVVEVDVPNLPSRVESARASFQALTARYPFTEASA
ncbi:sugar phosphate isomerase/epimerase [Microbacterium sp. MYb64]|uniref:sugar phosphate isomerase/epimerase family protein n=1 Tax=Microbacterium sp. MYb64 TaxID=1848691 RepID=UPI000CFE0FC6|nr:sugar phosphate isomerase/epimerase [Microbacterium sp. MYb64]PRB07511.1 inosose dehydratase [Microbacterium sp. MYb64]